MVQKLLREAGEAAHLGMRVFSHMLRHACGRALADRGLDMR
jgi:site-specific recombinase XerD